jgi:hypothetical protein
MRRKGNEFVLPEARNGLSKAINKSHFDSSQNSDKINQDDTSSNKFKIDS